MDFTSALYLGIKHDTKSLVAWQNLTTGKPAALYEHPAAGQAAKAVARLQGMETGMLYSSTLHLFWDLFEYWGKQRISIFLDRESYPIAGWGAERLSKYNVPIHLFPHNDAAWLRKAFKYKLESGRRPLVISDGWCVQCGKAAPISEYLDTVAPYDGWLILDDTQAFGLLGTAPTMEMPYGHFGGGTLARSVIQSDNVLVGSSLAKAFGVPVAVLSGPEKFIRKLQGHSLINLHCSPPSSATISAALHALSVNKALGEQRRRKLLHLVQRLKNGLNQAGISTSNGLFPVQYLTDVEGQLARAIHGKLQKQGIKTLLTNGHQDEPKITLLIRADHRIEEIDQAVHVMANNLEYMVKNRTYLSSIVENL